MYNYGRHIIDNDDIESLVKVLKSDNLTQGSVGMKFEMALSKYFGSSYACVVSNGTAALHLTGIALGWGESDVVITSPMTFLATANSIVYTRARPEFVDIDPNSYTLSPELLDLKITELKNLGKKVTAVIGVDYAGHPADWSALRCIAEYHKIQLINDNCHAIGAEYKGDKNYAAKYADVVTMSFHAVKHITTGEGGAVLTNNEEIADKLKRLRMHGVTKSRDKMQGYEGPWYYEMIDLGFNYRLTDFQSALGISQLTKLSTFLAKRREIAGIYNQLFVNDQRFKMPAVMGDVEHAYHLYPLQIKFDEIQCTKIDLFNKLYKKSVRLQTHYIPVHLQPYYRTNYGYKVGDFPVAEEFYKREISLPIFPSMENCEAEWIAEQILTSIR